MSRHELDETMKQLAEYIRLQEETEAIIDSLKDKLKEAMKTLGTDTLAGTEHKATLRTVTSKRMDTTALKKDLPEISAKYTKESITQRFTFV